MINSFYEKMYNIETTHWWFKAKKDLIIKLIKEKYLLLNREKSNISIIDFGCGVGFLLNELSKIGNVTGVDFSKQAIDFCRKDFSGKLLNCDCGKNMNFEEKYDIAIASDLIEHIKDDKLAIDNIYKSLKSGGYAIITVPAFQFLWSQHDVNNMHFRRYSIKQLLELIYKTKFKISYISYFNFFLFIPAAIIRIIKNILKFDKQSNIELTLPPTWLNNMLYEVFFYENNYLISNRKFPFGLSIIAVLRK